jgi:hypothetical protein
MIRAFALVLDDHANTATTSTIAERVQELLEPIIENLNKSTTEALMALQLATTSNADIVDELRTETRGISENFTATVTGLAESLTTAATEIAGHHERNTQTHLQPNQPTQLAAQSAQSTQLTYASAVLASTPPRHAEVVARSQGRSCQILIERNDAARGTNDDSANLSEKELVDKANLAVTLMGDLAAERPNPESSIFLGAQRRQRGAVLFLTRTPEAAEWLRAPQNKAAFLQHYGGATALRDRGFPVIVEFVPVQYDPASRPKKP